MIKIHANNYVIAVTENIGLSVRTCQLTWMKTKHKVIGGDVMKRVLTV